MCLDEKAGSDSQVQKLKNQVGFSFFCGVFSFSVLSKLIIDLDEFV